MKKFVFGFTLLVLYHLPCFTQSATDSLRHLISTQDNPEVKATNLILLADRFRYSNPDSLFSVSKELELLGKRYDNSEWQIYAAVYTATFFNLSGKPDTAWMIAQKNIAQVKGKNYELKMLVKLYSLAGNSLMRLNRQRDALEMFYDGLQQAETINDVDATFKAQNNIGWAYMELEQFEKAVTYFKACITTIRQNNVPDRIGTIYNNLASCYGSLGFYDSVSKYAATGIRIAKQYNDYSALANGYSILGTFQAKQQKFTEAVSSFQQAIIIREKVGDPFFIVSDLAEISELQSKTGNTTQGIINGEKALDIAAKNNIEAKLPMIYTALAHNYEMAGDYQKALIIYKTLNSLKDSLYNDANPKALAEIQTKYETVKKEQQIEQQRNKIRLQNYLFAGVAILATLAILLGFSYYKRYRLRQEAAMKSALMKQQELASKAVMEAEENERQRIAKDLHDGIGQMMSAAKMNLSAFESEIKFTDAMQRRSFEKAIELVDESCKEVRTVSHVMMPNALLKNNLTAAIHEFVDKLDKKTLAVNVYTEGINERLDSNTEIVLYRVLQECVNNVIKHAQATQLDISVIKDKDGINATIEDNGKGFDTGNATNFEGLGLKNIITRIDYLKGTVDFDSAPGRGTLVALHVPL